MDGICPAVRGVLAVAAAISARWEDDKINFSMKRRY